MLRIVIILVFVVGMITYVGAFAYQKVLSITLASGNANYYIGSQNAKSTSIMTIKACDPGYVPGLPGFRGTIDIHPRDAKLTIDSKIRMINGDTSPHTVGIAFGDFWESIDAGDSIEIKWVDVSEAGSWGITCDGIYLGEKSPTIVAEEF